MKKKLWIVSELFFPEETSTAYYLTEIAKSIAMFQEVNIICGAVSYEKDTNIKSLLLELPKNINIYRVKGFSFNKNILFLRTLRLIGTTWGLGFKLLIKVQKGDEVWLVTNPAFLMPFAVLISKIKRFRLTILVHDVFPENLIPANITNEQSILYRILKNIFDKAYSSADQIVVCGRDMAKVIAQKTKGKKDDNISVIENWADVDSIYAFNNSKSDIYGDLGLEKKIIFQFAGNIGRLQGLEQLLEIAIKCTNPFIHFVLVGEGALKSELKLIVKEKNITNVSFLDSFNRNQQNVFLNACDVGIVSLYDNMLGLGVPSKSYNIMAAGKPVLFLGNKNSEIGMMVNEHQIGWQFELSEHDNILEFFNKFNDLSVGIKGKVARVVAEKKYAKKIIIEKYLNLLN